MASGLPKGFEFIECLAKELSSRNLVFPTSVNATMRIRSALNDPLASFDKIAHIVSAEPVLSGHILKIANSAAINVSGKKITDLRSAITRLGFAMVKNIAISVGMRQLSQATQEGDMQPKIEKLWKHSVQVGAISYILAKKATRLNADEAMLAGLLHDIGQFYILTRAHNFPELFADEAALAEITLQWHTEIAQSILESWEIPEEIASAVRDHDMLDRNHSGPVDLTDVVMAANILAEPGAVKALVDQGTPAHFGQLTLDPEMCQAIMLDTNEEIKQIAQALR